MSTQLHKFTFPRRRILRQFLQGILFLFLKFLVKVRVEGKEFIPKEGPYVVVGNHFHFADPVAIVYTLPWHVEFLAGSVRPAAPWIVKNFPEVWGVYQVHRGAMSSYAMRAATYVIEQNGFLGLFPEAGAWATVLRPARPGAAYLAARTGAPILPVGIDGMTELFSVFRTGRRPVLTIRYGAPFGPFEVTGRGREKREQLDKIGEEIMLRIAELIPPERRGVFSDDPKLREEALKVADYPWA